jgi:hypothetical protein
MDLGQCELLRMNMQIIQALNLANEVALATIAWVPNLDRSCQTGCCLCCIIPYRYKSARSQHYDEFRQKLFTHSSLVWLMWPVAEWIISFMRVKWKYVPEKNRYRNQCKHAPDNSRRPLSNH